MSDPIPHQRLDAALPADSSVSGAAEVLPGEIAGLRTLFHHVAPGEPVTLAPVDHEGRVCLFVAGDGQVDDGSGPRRIDEIALFAPPPQRPLDLTAGDAALRLLELRLAFTAQDRTELESGADHLPWFVPYSRCSTYRERIKSPKTTSRTLMPEHTFPRLCAGSVQTTGDDRVAAHAHPMLEQLFLGLPGNRCTVRADDASLEFGADHLLHIPLGSTHGVEVAAPQELHYIWIDIFADKRGMDWITREHIPDP